MAPYHFSSCIFCTTGCESDPNNFKVLLKEHEEFLCLDHGCCLAVNDDGYGAGVEASKAPFAAKSGHCLNIKAYCCHLGLKYPETLCRGASKCLCIEHSAALPFDSEFVKEPMCAICFVQLLPEVGILKEAPAVASMVR